MKKSTQYFNWLTITGIVILIFLLGIQINWLQKASQLQKEQEHLNLLRIVPEIASSFYKTHQEALRELDTLSTKEKETLESIMDSIMVKNGISNKTYFALFQDTTNGIYISNHLTNKDELLNSTYKECISCYISFAIYDGPLDNEENYDERKTITDLTITRPVDNYLQLPGSKTAGELLWLSIYVPNPLSSTLKTLRNIFFASIALLLLVIFLFYYLLKIYTKQKKASKIKEDFFNNLSHEFKTPLSSIHLASRVLRESKNVEKNKTYLDLIERESKSLEERLSNVLELSLISNSEIHQSKDPVNIHEIIKQMPKRLGILIEQKKASIDLSLNIDNPIIYANKTQISNCIYNLIENALKYGGENVHINIETFKQDKSKVLIVRDNGPGIDKQYHAGIFDRFFRVQKNNQYKGQGFGIGLSYVKEVLSVYGGTIQLNPNYNKGCEFIINI